MWSRPSIAGKSTALARQAGAGLKVLQTQEATLQSACVRAVNQQWVLGCGVGSRQSRCPLESVGSAENSGFHVEGAAQRLPPH